jgi:hypothetical protein
MRGLIRVIVAYRQIPILCTILEKYRRSFDVFIYLFMYYVCIYYNYAFVSGLSTDVSEVSISSKFFTNIVE